jgi:hypothetical protein
LQHARQLAEINNLGVSELHKKWRKPKYGLKTKQNDVTNRHPLGCSELREGINY